MFTLTFTSASLLQALRPSAEQGNLIVAEGQTADDGMLAGMMTYVKGVEGDIPK